MKNITPLATQDNFPKFVVGIGGSAGGLKAYTALLEALPPNTGMAFVFIAHLSPNSESLLAGLLSRSTKMPATQAAEGMAILANHVYVIAPNTNLLMENYTFKVVSPRTLNKGRHNQVDYFLSSLAETMGARAIGIILSGGDGDGTEGCKIIKAKGGKTFAQDLSADVDSMPLHAQASGCVDYVLPPDKISDELTKIGASFAKEEAAPDT
jgi:two-component system CheB/CheR fusion protein